MYHPELDDIMTISDYQQLTSSTPKLGQLIQIMVY